MSYINYQLAYNRSRLRHQRRFTNNILCLYTCRLWRK